MKRYAGIIALGLMAVVAAFSFREETSQTKPRQPTPSEQTTSGSASNLPKPSGFDFYVLSLSWSPSYCASSAGAGNRQQCGADRRYGFVVHGLWPQNENGYPEFCASREPDRVPDAVGRQMFDIMPSMGLIGHQWRKHGSCSGLSQKDYFAVTRAAFEAVKLPSNVSSGKQGQTISANELEKAFTAVNPGMSQQGVSISCDAGRFEEIRICLTHDLNFRSCQQVDRQGCQTNNMTIPPIR